MATTTFVDSRTSTRYAAHAEPITGHFGAFWFFRPDNPELFLEVLDGTALTIRDTVTGVEREYVKPPFGFQAFSDFEALPGH